MSEVVICATGIANVASVIAGFHRLGADARLSEDSEELLAADRVMLPGVGAFGAGMARLKELGLDEVIQSRIQADRPTMAICLGLQVLSSSSAEGPGVPGLAVFDGLHVEEFPDSVRVPQLGWNEVEANSESRFIESGWAYFANSYCLRSAPEGWDVAWADYAGPFVAAAERGAVLACQFHPELSGPWGLDVMRRWLEG